MDNEESNGIHDDESSIFACDITKKGNEIRTKRNYVQLNGTLVRR